jgi:predicted SnoaL-like aldol condensation-catalyzing enzyme
LYTTIGRLQAFIAFVAKETRMTSKTVLTLLAMPLVAGALAFAQQPPPPAVQANPAPGCKVSPAELEANRKVAMEFFRTAGDARVALADPSYKQHNPAFVKGAQEAKMNDFDYFKSRFGGAARQGGGGAAPRAGGPPPGPQPPAGNPFEVVTAECDIVTIVHKVYTQDPTLPPGNFYERFTFDTFRVRNGKLVEHWDAAQINPPAPAGGGRGN